jgi:hypothetical protein
MQTAFRMNDEFTPKNGSPDRAKPGVGKRLEKLFVVTVIVAIISLMATGIGFLNWVFNANPAAIMAKGAVEVTATIVNKEVRESFNEGRTRLSHYVDLTYTDAAGDAHEGRVSVSAQVYDAVSVGQLVPLRYAVANPNIFELREGGLQANSTWGFKVMIYGLIGVGVSVLGGIMLLWMVNRRRAKA